MKYAPYSNSKISKGHCPYAFKRRYIDKDPGHSRGNLRFGAGVHQIIADILNSKTKGQPYNVQEILENRITIDLIDRVSEIQSIIDIFLERFEVDYDHVVGVEEKVAIDEKGYEASWDNSYLRGILDVVEINGTHATIIDHKTQYNILSDEDMRKNAQLSFYAMLTKAAYPQVESFTVKIYFARYGFSKESERTLEDVRRCWDGTQLAVSCIENIEEWVPIPGPTCSICEYMHECPLAKYDSRGEMAPAVLTAEEAKKQAKLLRVREEQVKQIKITLSQYAASNGPIRIGDDWEYGYVPSETVDWPVESTQDVFRRHNYPIAQHINFSKASLRKLLKRADKLDHEFADALRSVGERKATTVFKGYKT